MLQRTFPGSAFLISGHTLYVIGAGAMGQALRGARQWAASGIMLRAAFHHLDARKGSNVSNLIYCEILLRARCRLIVIRYGKANGTSLLHFRI